MKKRVISTLLVIALVLSYVLVSAPVAEAAVLHPHDSAAPTHCACGQANSTATFTGHQHKDVQWQKWPGSGSVVDGGYYYLDKNYNTDILNYSGNKNFTLCLNGYSITQSTRVTVRGSLTICDCSSNPGTITSNYNSTEYAGGIATVYENGTFNLFSVNLVHAVGNSVTNGGGIFINANATFNMYSGTITGGTASNNGGNVHVLADGKFNMYGGTLYGTKGIATAQRGANIYSKGAVSISGDALIIDGKANNGGNIYLDSGTFAMTGGTITCGIASTNGGNIYTKIAIDLGDDIVVSNGSAKFGGNVLLYSAGKLNLSGNARILNGTATTGGNISVYNSENSVFTMTGGTVIGGSVSRGENGVVSIQAGFLQLAEDVTTVDNKYSIASNNGLVIDLNGHTLSGAVTGKIGLADASISAGTGAKANVQVSNLDVNPVVNSPVGRYITLKDSNGDLFIHRIYVGFDTIQLTKDDDGKIGMNYVTNIKMDDEVKKYLTDIEMVSGESYAVGCTFGAGSLGTTPKGYPVTQYKANISTNINAILGGQTAPATAAATKIYAQAFVNLKINGTEYPITSNIYDFCLLDIINALYKVPALDSKNPAAAALLADIKSLYGISADSYAVTTPLAYPDYTFNSTPTSDDLRQMAVKAMLDFLSVQWYVDNGFTYNKTGAVGDKTYIYNGDTTYCGLPYTNGDKGLIQFLEYYNPETGRLDFDGTGEEFNQQFGGTCACGVMWSWSTVCDSLTGAFVNYNMVPKYGCILVGDYAFGDGIDPNSIDSYLLDLGTDTICGYNGKEAMFAAYAQTKPADGLTSSTQNHAMMIISEPVVKYSNGAIDGANSYLYIADQRGGTSGDGNFYEKNENGETLHYSGRTSYKYSFNQLYNASYIPVTTVEFAGSDAYKASDVKLSLNSFTTAEELLTAEITSNFPICVLNIDLVDASGNSIKLTSFQTDKNDVLSGLARKLPLESFAEFLNTEALRQMIHEGRTYDLQISVTVSNGEIFTVAQFPITR